MSYQPPTTVEEFNRCAHEGVKITGYGVGTTCSMPCPFCAAPEFMTYKVLESEETFTKGAVCKHCGRGARGITTRPGDGSVRLEFVQTCGPDQPEWLAEVYPMRREESPSEQQAS